jgi:SpoIID/LytB domain protein
MDINGYSYEGSIELVRSNNAWLAVNELSLENYVASVVGSEMPSRWHGEALKAQAVAARSYAVTHLVRPASQTLSPRRHHAMAGVFRDIEPE